jgi:hypothetical protein
MPVIFYVLILGLKTEIMNKKLATITIVSLMIIFLGYIIYDLAVKDETNDNKSKPADTGGPADMWVVSEILGESNGKLKAVAVMNDGKIILGGASFISCYDADLKLIWNTRTEDPVTALSASGDTIFATTQELILLLNSKGVMLGEWGPFEDKAIITSVATNGSYVAFADAGNKLVFILDREGEVKSMVGQSGEQFIVPSPYFDVALSTDNKLFVANTGNRRIEIRKIDGSLIGNFGEPGTAPGAFCGCCNPAHFALIPGGFVTAEKGINRIKLLDEKGGFNEFVSSVNDFIAPLPLDIATADGKTIYGANPADNKLYVFKRK